MVTYVTVKLSALSRGMTKVLLADGRWHMVDQFSLSIGERNEAGDLRFRFRDMTGRVVCGPVSSIIAIRLQT